jgi:hypothetical protein
VHAKSSGSCRHTVVQTTGLILDAETELGKQASKQVSLDEAGELLASELNPIFVDEVV